MQTKEYTNFTTALQPKHPAPQFFCTICKRGFDNERALQQHSKTKLHFRCKQCHKHFISEAAVLQHVKDVHDKAIKIANKEIIPLSKYF